MSRESARIADTRAWLRKAANDMRAAEHDTSATSPLLEDIVFHCQQVAEKSLKAFLTWHDKPFRTSKSLVRRALYSNQRSNPRLIRLSR